MIDIVTGDDVQIPITLKRNGSTFSISASATVRVAIIDKNHSALLAGPISVSSSEPDSNWALSMIVVNIPGKATEHLAAQVAQIEVEVNDVKRKTWHADVRLVKGLIR